MSSEPLLGAWRQIEPSTAPDEIIIRFESNGRCVWSFEGEASLEMELTWTAEGSTLVTGPPGEPHRSNFRLESPGLLAVERDGVVFRYARCG